MAPASTSSPSAAHPENSIPRPSASIRSTGFRAPLATTNFYTSHLSGTSLNHNKLKMASKFQYQQQRQEHGCLRFLSQHHQYGGLTEDECKKLHSVIKMISALGRGIHRGEFYYTVWYSRSIRQALSSVRKGVVQWLDRSCDVGHQILSLWRENLDGEQAIADRWAELLGTLQDPTDNDTVFYTMIFEHFDRLVFRPLINIRDHETLKDPFGIEVYPELVAVHQSLQDIKSCAQHCDELVEMLHHNLAEHRAFIARDGRPRTPEAWEALVWPQTPTKPSFLAPPRSPGLPLATSARDGAQSLLPAVSVPDPHNRILKSAADPLRTMFPPRDFSKSFSAAEEAIARQRQCPATSDYTTIPRNASGTWYGGGTVGHRRKGASVPRIFTTSFGKLEHAVQKMNLHRVKTPEDSTPPLPEEDAEGDPVKIRDFAGSQVGGLTDAPSAPCPYFNPLLGVVSPKDLAESEEEGMSLPTAKMSRSKTIQSKARSSPITATDILPPCLKHASPTKLPDAKRGHYRQREYTI